MALVPPGRPTGRGGLVAAYAGGPEPHPNYAVHHATLLASRDPVAVDAVALRTIEGLRAARNFPPIGERAMHIEVAAQLGLGTADLTRVQVKELGR